jgi:hypothetical protein
MRGGEDRPVAQGLQAAHDGRADHAAVAGHEDRIVAASLSPRLARTDTSWPCALSSAWRRAAFRSSATISAHISCAVISGTQPSLALALVGSPSSVSTSAGRK